ncbi:hypothetical protein [Clostridium sporogenes]|uniref:Uncharacterized protein n=1 Tax=Clostridium sporogenes TaxID=1509 RepID=A0A7U4LMZ6_CLOSG|nr:hypothetical protein [Clostridium sporogenes]AKC62817.1 hypothetical protein CLSPO_c20970 [Clostridium sporogenes]AKJ90068.1 hypothetical protein CLSPOx_10560 [Clostridium sporogenes]KCZ68195.1 hypothetical protein CSPO_6c02380 [Clostridium sporogenes]KOY64363.1 hypothetical protein AN649_18765 [Clostridium sporogenes]OOO65331.1 hypothetical protein BS099_15705 [Clostridium sporogenes]
MDSIWALYGTSDFPLNQPMVGQKDFYDTFKGFTKTMKNVGMATIFPLIAKWGIGKSRIGFEIVSEPLGMDKGWVITEDGEQKKVRIFKENFEDGVLPIYIRYSQMCYEDLIGDYWVGFGAYTALSILSKEPDDSIQGKIMKEIQNAFEPMGFDREILKGILKVGEVTTEDLLSLESPLDGLVKEGMEYLKEFGIEHLLVVCDELETAGEIAKYGIEKDRDEMRKVDGEAINVITSAIKHEDPKKKYPNVSYLLLCSPVIGDSIQGIGALNRRTEMCEMVQNSFADIVEFTDYLAKNNINSYNYPEGLIEAAYTIAGGNFGWFNVIMANVDQYLNDKSDGDTGEIFESLLNTSSRFKMSLIDKDAFEYIRCEEKYRKLIKTALLTQLPLKKSTYTSEKIDVLLDAKAENGEKLFKEFYNLRIAKDDIGSYLNSVGYKRESGNLFVNEIGGSFDLQVLLKSLKTFSLNVKENEYLVGADKETFIDQVRMLYPKDNIDEAGEYIFQYILERVNKEDIEETEYIGPSFAYLQMLDKRYKVERGDFGYALDSQQNKEIEEHIEELRRDKKGYTRRVLSGFARAIEMNYPEEKPFELDEVPCMEVKIGENPFLDVNQKNIVHILWGKDEEALKKVIQNKNLLNQGVHPVFVICNTHDVDFENKLKDDFKEIGKCLIFISLTKIQEEMLEVMSINKEKIDFRDAADQVTSSYKEKIRKIKDLIGAVSRKWFDEIDAAGWVLRPIIYKKHNKEDITLLAKSFKRMVINDVTYEQLGSDPKVKLKDGEYSDLSSILRNVSLGRVYENKGYRETGLFIKDRDSFYIEIPSCMKKILEFVNDSKQSNNEFEARFFFSCFDKFKPKKILEQWIQFFVELRLLVKKQGLIEKISKYDLYNKFDQVKGWFDTDYKAEITNMKKLIDGPYMSALSMQDTYYKEKLQEINNIKNTIQLDIFTRDNDDFINNWKDGLSKLEEFYELCYMIFDRNQWDSYKSYNENIIKELKVDDLDKPLWYRIKHVRLFLDHIKDLKNPAAKMVKEKIDKIKQENEYKGYEMPISPVTNILDSYCNELEYATDLKSLTTYRTMVKTTSTLAYKLQAGEYGDAVIRLENILEECGIEGKEVRGLNWSGDSGVIGDYKGIFKSFKNMVDGYLYESKDAEHWAKYFLDAPDNLKNMTEVKNINSDIMKLSIYLESGLYEEIEEKEAELLNKPKEYLEYLKESVENMEQVIGVIRGYKESIKNKAREEKNKLYDDVLIASIEKIRKIKEGRFVTLGIDKSNYPSENTYGETNKVIGELIAELNKEGNKYFEENAKYTKFDFFKSMIEANGDINWNDRAKEKRELESLKFIKTKVEVL